MKYLILLAILFSSHANAASTAEQIQLGFLSNDTGICGTRPLPCWTPYSNTNPLPISGGGGGSGTVTSFAFTNANGASGSVATATTTPTLTLTPTAGGTFASSANNLGFFAATTSAQLAGVISDETGTGPLVFSNNATFVAPALGTPASGVATNLTGIAAGLTAGNVTTNANLTGPITSSGNATSIAAQTGTGTTFVTQASPTITGTLTASTVTEGTTTITSTSANCFDVGPNGATNPVIKTDCSTASQAVGLTITGAASGGTVGIVSGNALSLQSSGGSFVTVQGGSGGVAIKNGSSGIFQINGVNTVFSPLTGSTASTVRFLYTVPADTALTASTNAVLTSFAGAGVVRQWSTGALTTQTDYNFGSPTIAFVGASTVTNAGTISLTLPGCGTNATCTNVSGIYHPTTALTGTPTNSFVINVASDSGATNNFAAQFDGGVNLLNQTTGTNADFLCLSSGGKVLVQTSACTISSMRFKENIHFYANDALPQIEALRPVTFTMKPNDMPNADINFDRKQIGLIAEEVEKVNPLLAIYEQDGKTPKSYRQESVIALLVKGLQEEQAEIESLKRNQSGHRCYGIFWCGE